MKEQTNEKNETSEAEIFHAIIRDNMGWEKNVIRSEGFGQVEEAAVSS